MKDGPQTPPPATPQEIAATLANLGDMMRPAFEFIKGVRTQLEADGWSPTMAEHLAAELLTNLMRQWFPAEKP